MLNAIRYGLLFASAIFLWAVAETLVGLHGRYIRYHEYLSYFFAVPAVIIMYSGVRPARHMQQRQSFRSGLLKGLAITAVVVALCPLVWYVFCTFVNPGFLGNMVTHAVEDRGMDPQAAARRYSLYGYITVSVLSTAIVGSVISLVMAIIMAARKR